MLKLYDVQSKYTKYIHRRLAPQVARNWKICDKHSVRCVQNRIVCVRTQHWKQVLYCVLYLHPHPLCILSCAILWSHWGLGRKRELDGGGRRESGYGTMLKDSNVISLQISTAGIMQQIGWIGSSSIRTMRTSVPVHGIPGIRGVRVTVLPPRRKARFVTFW